MFALLFQTHSFSKEVAPKSIAHLFDTELENQMYEKNQLRDTQKCELDLEGINNKIISPLNSKSISIQGKINYVGLFTGKYQYDVNIAQEEVVISTKIFLRNIKHKSARHSDKDLLEAKEKVKWAQDYWNSFVPAELPIRFKFIVVSKRDDAYFLPALINKSTRGPYYASWSTRWHPIVIAHEIGHMLGLDDEYANNFYGGNTDSCDKESLMCSNSLGSIVKKYQILSIINRINCQK